MIRYGLVLAGILFSLFILLFSPLDIQLAKGLFLLTFIAVLWVSEIIHITVTALIVPILAVCLQISTVKEALSNFSHPIIFLFLGGFAIAAALRKHRIDRMLARKIVAVAGGNEKVAVFILFAITALISMWISNTATTAMILPIALGFLKQADPEQDQTLYVFVLLGIAYSANIGGMGTLVGSPPNAIAASVLDISFRDWTFIGVPIIFVMLPVMLFILFTYFKPNFSQLNLSENESIEWRGEQFKVIIIFVLTVMAWMLSKPLGGALGITKGMDSVIALGAVVALVLSRSIEWQDVDKNTDWGVLLLFGGGITLSMVLSNTGTSRFLADQMLELVGAYGGLIVLVLAITLMIFLTELASNTASAALLVPIFYAMPSDVIGLSSSVLALGVAFAASCAFMLPVATPPNAIVYGTGFVAQRQMIRVGLVLNAISVLILTLIGWVFLA